MNAQRGRNKLPCLGYIVEQKQKARLLFMIMGLSIP